MKNQPFVLDFSKWCVGYETRASDGKQCAIGQWNDFRKQTSNRTKVDECAVVTINDSRVSRKEKVKQLRKIFKQAGIDMVVKNFWYGMRRVK